MNNGIFLPWEKPFSSNNLERIYNSTGLAPLQQLRNSLPSNSFDYPNTSINNGLLHFPANNEWKLDYNNVILVVDTTKTTYNTDAEVTFRVAQCSLPTVVDWGDDSYDMIFSERVISHKYKKHGLYYVQVNYGTTPQYYNADTGTGRDGKIIGILSYGNKNAIHHCYLYGQNGGYLNFVPKVLPSGLTSISNLVQQCAGPLKNIGLWNISNLNQSFTQFFAYGKDFNEKLDSWRFHSGVTNLSSMLIGQAEFNNGDTYNLAPSLITYATPYPAGTGLNNWNVGNITNMSSMFQQTRYFNQDLNLWDVSKVTNFSSMFDGLFSTYTQHFDGNLSNWQLVANNVNCSNMFRCNSTTNSSLFTGKGLSSWNTSGVSNMAGMFQNCVNFNQNLSSWNVRKVTNFSSMFNGATSFNGSLSGWAPGVDTAATSCQSMFQSASKFVGNGLESWDTSKVTNMYYMFLSDTSLGSGISLNLSNWNVSGVTLMTSMFQNCTNLTNATISGWSAASGCDHSIQFREANISGSYLPNWTFKGNNNATLMFFCNMTNVSGLNTWNTSGITNMQQMFYVATNFNADLSGWDVSNVTNMNSMFMNTLFQGSGLQNWNLARLSASTSLDNFAAGCNFPSGQYDSILNSWNNTKASGVNGIANWRTDLKPHFGSSKYTSAASGARASLVSYGWTITDGGPV